MSNYSRRIIVICNSDIILKGLAEILSGCHSDEVILLHQSNDLVDYPHLTGYLLVILPLKSAEESGAFLRRVFFNVKEVRYLYLNIELRSDSSGGSFHIYENYSAIAGKANELLNSFGTKDEENTFNELSKREIDVLRLVSKGLANKEVADKLSISIHTVISHRKNISEKTGIKSSSGLTMYAVLKKIIDIDEISTSDLI
jgi:DNA-binding CsgD family transcriptional regulator